MRLMEVISPIITEDVQPIALAKDGYTIEQVNKVVDFIRANCTKWLAETNNGRYTFFRGIRANMASYHAFTKTVRTDRQPRDSIPLGHDTYNAMIEAVGGIADRSNSVFATSKYSEARNYGTLGGQASVIFPIGDYHYTWSKKWDDWNIESTESLESMISQYMIYTPDLQADAEYAWEEMLDQLESSAANAQSEDAREELEQEIRLLSTPAGKFDYMEEYIEDSDSNSMLFELFTDPDNYHVDRLKQVIMVDEGLTAAADLHHEVMIQCANVLYINNEFYELVWSVLNGKEPDFTVFGKVPGEAP